MPDPIGLLAAHCMAAVSAAPQVAGVAGLFLLGLGGSLGHCGAMCGPLVAGQVADRLAAVPAERLCEAHRLRAGLLLPYHLGRLTTYTLLGAAAGAAGLAFMHRIAPLRGVLLLAAACVLLVGAWRRLAPGAQAAKPQAGPQAYGGPALRRQAGWTAAGGALFRWTRRLDRTRLPGAFGFGLALGLLPCGLLYAALIGACALGGPAAGAAGMLAFGLATVPVLAVIGVAGQAPRLRGGLARAAPWVMVFNAAVLVIAALAGVLV